MTALQDAVLYPNMIDLGTPSPAADTAPPAADIALSETLLHNLLDPALTLDQVAQRHDLALSDLLVILAEPGPAAQLAAIHHLAIQRTRLIAASNAPRAIAALGAVLEALPRSRPRFETVPADAPSSLQTTPNEKLPPLLHVRRLETIRRAATTLLSLQRLSVPLFHPLPPQLSASSQRFPTASMRHQYQHQHPQPEREPTHIPLHDNGALNRLIAESPRSETASADQATPTLAQSSPPNPHADVAPESPAFVEVQSRHTSPLPSPTQLPDDDLPRLNDHWSFDNPDDPSDPALVAASAAHEHWP